MCDERYDNAVVRVDKNGFHPAVYYIQKSQSVMWVWKGGEDEAHNIIHVKSPDSDVSTLETFSCKKKKKLLKSIGIILADQVMQLHSLMQITP